MMKDARDGWRALAASPTLAVTALLTLAIGIGTSTAVFAVADALLLRALPYPAADRLVALTDVDVTRGESVNVGLANFDDWRASVPAVEAAAAWRRQDVNVSTSRGADRLPGIVAAGDFFDILGAVTVAGRTFADSPRDAATGPVVVLSDRAWHRLFDGRRDAIGSTAWLDGGPHEVIGVVQRIPGQMDVDVWRPVARTGAPPNRGSHNYVAVARVQAGVPIDEARAQFDVVAARLAAAYPETNADWRVGLLPLQDALGEDLNQTLILVSGAAILLLLIACTNVAGLLLVRGYDRRREFAVRKALGAARYRIVRQLLSESVMLSLASAGAGLLVSWWGTGVIVSMLPPEVVLWREPTLSAGVLGFTVILAVGTGLLFGLAPVVTMVREDALEHLRGGGGNTPTGSHRTRIALTYVQFSLASVLLIAAGLLLASLWRAARADPGFDPRSVLTFQVTLPRTTHADVAAVSQYFLGLTERLSALPQVDAAGAIDGLPMAGNETISTVRRPDEPTPGRGDERWALHQVSTPGYLRATGTRLVAGRDFEAGDTQGGPRVAIVNESLARLLWRDATPIGRELVLESGLHRVVGMIADVRHFGFDGGTYPQYFVPFAQSPVRSLSFALRTRGSLTESDLRQLAASVDSTVPLYSLRTLEAVGQDSLSPRRSLTGTVVFCGAAAVLLSAIGLFAIVASGVRERRREIAIRMALGATDAGVMWLFVRRASATAVAGIVTGFLASYWATGVLEGSLFEVTRLDAMTLAASAVTLLVVTITASWLPARRATTIAPMESLKTGT